MNSTGFKEKLCTAFTFLKISLLLLSPFLMGQMISITGNNELLIRRFAELRNDNLSDPAVKSRYEKTISWGCMFPFGGMFGALIAAYMVDKIGRKYSNIFFLMVMILGNILDMVSYNYGFSVLYTGRFIVGFASAALMVSSIVWMFEVLPPTVVRVYKPLVQITINLGITIISILGSYLVFGDIWYKFYFTPIALASLEIIVSFMIPESPQWLLTQKNDEEAASRSLMKIRGSSYDPQEFDLIKGKANADRNKEGMTISQFLMTRRFWPAIVSSIMCHCAQQLSGINAIMAFPQDLAAASRFVNSELMAIIILSVTFGFSVIFAPLVDRFPRKLMLVIGHGGMAIFFLIYLCLPTDGYQIFRLISLSGVASIFQAGPGPLVWFITLEIFPSSAGGVAQGICSIANWTCNLLVFFGFPFLKAYMGTNVLFIFVVTNIIFALFIIFMVAETRQRESEQILNDYSHRYRLCCSSSTEPRLLDQEV